LIIVAILVGLANGFRRGLVHSISQYAGLVAGVVGGAAAAPPLLNLLGLYNSVGSTIGFWLGDPLRRALLGRARTGTFERVTGAALSVVMVASVAWFLGLALHRGPSPQVASLVQRSTILQKLSVVAPQPPGFLAQVESTISGVPFPETFAGIGLEPGLTEPLPVPGSVDTAGVAAARGAVFRVESRGCGGLVTGSAYPIAPGYLVTNAHVVSGTSETQVTQDTTGSSYPADVVLFDPERDVAILHAPGLHVAPLVSAPADRGTTGAVIGYPGGGAETAEPAVVDSQRLAEGRDIYGNGLVTRQIWVIGAKVRPGNSGGPLVDLQGHVIGLIFAASSTDPDQAYALTNDEIAGDVQSGPTRTAPIDAAVYSCAV
jgi:S1-C subfamily serine protease